MRDFPLPFNETARLQALALLDVLDTEAEPIFDRAAAVARTVMNTPTALVSLVDYDRQWFKAREGFDLPETPRSLSLCAYTIMTDAPLVIPDTRADPVFARHPAVKGDAPVLFYVGAPIILSSGFRVGSLCALDYAPREAPAADAIEALRHLAGMAADALETRLGAPGISVGAPPCPAETARMEFLSLISHELRTPLNGVIGLAGILASRNEDPTSAKLLNALVDSGESLRRIVEHILHFSDAATGDLQLSEATVETRTLLEQLGARNAPAAGLAGKTLRIAGAIAPERVTLDPIQFEVALSCLVSNAVVHGGPTIEIGCRQAERGEPVFTVADDGADIPEKRKTAIHSPFRIGEDVMRRTASGIGMGLPLSNKLVELHGGELSLKRQGGRTVAAARLPHYRNADLHAR